MRKILVSAAAVAAIATAAPAFAQTTTAGPSSPSSATASATIVAPITITKKTDLGFGSIASDSAGGTVTVNAAGGLTSSNPNMVISGSTGSAAHFDVDGQAGLAYNFSWDPTVTLSGPGDDMTATLSGTTTGPVDNGNLDDATVTGTLNVGPSQAAGVYNGTFNVSVQYQ